ncbi:MAG: quinolinate synthase NadA [Anaerolineae bacterium]
MKLPEAYTSLPDAEVTAQIEAARRTLGSSLTILGHHYQRDEVIRHADFRGDSLELSRRAAQVREARYIVFCGVHFMAETAAMLCGAEQVVIQPVIEALCPMAALANAEDVQAAWNALSGLWDGDLIPVTYQNSTAAIKGFVGQQGGAVCTSSNADKVFAWAFARGSHLFFLPDEHLGTNTAMAMGIPREEIGVWDPLEPPDPVTLAGARVVVWKGFCYVHTGMRPEDVDQARARYPDALVIVHPECTHEVVARADLSGSTARIIQVVEQAPAGATIVVGTEWHLVQRLALEHPDKTVVPLRKAACATMGMTTERHLLYALDGILQGQPRNVVTVEAETAHWARVALERMLGAR